MDDLQQIAELINSSPLKDNQKEELKTMLNSEGANENFYNKFNSLLLTDLEQRNEGYVKAATEQEQKIDHADQELARKREKINGQLKDYMGKMNPSDLAQSKRVWDQYYEAVSTIEEDYRGKLEEA